MLERALHGAIAAVGSAARQALRYLVLEEVRGVLASSAVKGAPQDRQQPRPRGAAIEPVEGPEGAHQRIRDKILGLVRVTDRAGG